MPKVYRLIVLAVFVALPPLVLPAEDGVDKVKALLLARLRSDGVAPGYNAARRTVVCEGLASTRYNASTDQARLMDLRMVLHAEATLKAKAKLVSYLQQNRSAWEQVVDRVESDRNVWRSSAGSVLRSQKVLCGCLIRDSVELRDEGLLFVAVAVEWGESLERDVRDVGRGGVALTRDDLEHVWSWVKKKGPLSCLGGRFCVLPDGFNFPVAVAAADIEGKNKLQLDVTTKSVEQMARGAFDNIFNTALIVNAREESVVQVAESPDRRSLVAADVGKRSIVAVAGADKIVKQQVVFEDVIRDPETGHRIHVIAYGPRIGLKLR